jgi:hypothetical protein
MFDFTPSSSDNAEIHNCYLKAKQKLQEGAEELEQLEWLLKDKHMAISKTDRKPMEQSITAICAAAWRIHVQGYTIKQAGAKSRIMKPCENLLTN